MAEVTIAEMTCIGAEHNGYDLFNKIFCIFNSCQKSRFWSTTATGASETSEATASKESTTDSKGNSQSEQTPNEIKLTEEKNKLAEEMKSFKVLE